MPAGAGIGQYGHHFGEAAGPKVVRRAPRAAAGERPRSHHTLRHSFAIQPLERGAKIGTALGQVRHADVRTTQIYTHVIERGGRGVRSPLGAVLGGG